MLGLHENASLNPILRPKRVEIETHQVPELHQPFCTIQESIPHIRVLPGIAEIVPFSLSAHKQFNRFQVRCGEALIQQYMRKHQATSIFSCRLAIAAVQCLLSFSYLLVMLFKQSACVSTVWSVLSKHQVKNKKPTVKKKDIESTNLD